MDALIIEATIQTPSIYFDPENNKFEISKQSLPEDSDEFYLPVITWLKLYIEQPVEQTDFHFKLDYYNTASARYIASIIYMLDAMSKKHNVKVFWHYRKIDEDMLANGEGFSETTHLNFELVGI